MTAVVPLPGDSWQSYAACSSKEAQAFFTSNSARARGVCCSCPVRAECLHDALVSKAPDGIWGGLAVEERKKVPALPRTPAIAIAALREVLAAYDLQHAPVPQPPADTATQGRRRKATRPAKPSAPAVGAEEEMSAAAAKAAARAERREQVADMLRQGAVQRQIIDRLGVSSSTIASVRKEFGIPVQAGAPGFRYTPEQRAAYEQRTVEMLRTGATYQQITDEVGITSPTIVRIRRQAGLPAPNPGRNNAPPRTVDEGLAASAELYGDGHARWTGPMTGRMPQLHAAGGRFNARHVIFERHHGRPPVGRVQSNCGDVPCVAGAHLTDDVLRDALPEGEPVTIRALHNLLDEIDAQGGPQAARDNRLRLPSEEPAMATAPEPAAPAPAVRAVPSDPPAPADTGQVKRPSEALPIGRLLKWAEDHDDADIQATAQRTRADLTGLRNRYDTDHELARLATETEGLEKQLAELRARQAELAPPKPRKRGAPDPDGVAARAWAKETGVDCPATGRVPKAVVDAWRAATGQPAGGSS